MQKVLDKQIDLLKSNEINEIRNVNGNNELISSYLKNMDNATLKALMSKFNSKGNPNLKNELFNYIYGVPEYQGPIDDSTQIEGALSVHKILTKLSEKETLEQKSRMGLLKVREKSSPDQVIPSDFLLNKEITIDNILTKEIQESSDSSFPLLTSELHRYHPGFSMHFVKKFCVLKKDNFSYFRSYFSHLHSPQKPLVSIPINLIQSVSPVSVEIPELRKNPNKEKDQNLNPMETRFKFEIFLKENEDTKFVINNDPLSNYNPNEIQIQEVININDHDHTQKIKNDINIPSIKVHDEILQSESNTISNLQPIGSQGKYESPNLLEQKEIKFESNIINENSKVIENMVHENKEALNENNNLNVLENVSDIRKEKETKEDLLLRVQSNEHSQRS